MTHPVPTPPARLLRGRDMADTLPPLPEPFDYCYEWKTGYGIVRKFSATPHHGMPPTRTVALYTADQMRAALSAVPAQPVAWLCGGGHPRHISAVQTITERRIYGLRQPLYAAPQAVPVPAWQPIETAPRGSGEDGPAMVNDPDYVAPPELLLMTPDGMTVGAYDWYYHAGYGRGAEPGVPAWRQSLSAEPIYDATHWMPLPAAPKEQPHE